MSESVNFDDLLNQKVEDAERPVPLPKGTYDVLITRHDTGTSSKKGTPYVRVFFRIENPHDDVNKEELKKVKDVGKKEYYDDFYMTENAAFRLRDLLEQTIKVNVKGRAFKEALADIKGKRAKVIFRQELTENKNVISRVDRWL